MSLYDDFDREKFYRNLKYLTQNRKITLKSLSERIGISEGYLAKVGNKNSKIMPGIDTIIKILCTLNVTFEQLCCEELGKTSPTVMPEFDETTLLNEILQKTQSDELDWERAKFDENTNCPQEELFNLVLWNEETGVYTYKSGFAAGLKEQRQAILPFYVAKIEDSKGIIIAGYSLYEKETPDFDEFAQEYIPDKCDVFFEIYIYLDREVYPVAESNPKYERKETRMLVKNIVRNAEEYVNQRKKRIIFKNFFGKEIG